MGKFKLLAVLEVVVENVKHLDVAQVLRADLASLAGALRLEVQVSIEKRKGSLAEVAVDGQGGEECLLRHILKHLRDDLERKPGCLFVSCWSIPGS